MAPLAAVVDDLAAQDLDGLPDAALAEEALALRRLLDRLEGQWHQRLAAVDGRGAAGADHGTPASTASWLRNRLHLGAAAAHNAVRTARALFRGPSPKRPRPCATASSPQPTPARSPTAPVTSHSRWPPRPRRCWWRRPDASTHPGCGGWSPTCTRLLIPRAPTTRPSGAIGGGAVAGPNLGGHGRPRGLLEPEAGQTLAAALEPLARPASAHDTRSGDQRRADALVELARRTLGQAGCPRAAGSAPNCR